MGHEEKDMELEYMDEVTDTRVFKRYVRGRNAKERRPAVAMRIRFHNQNRISTAMPPEPTPAEFQAIIGGGPLPIAVGSTDPDVTIEIVDVEFDDDTLFKATLGADGKSVEFEDQGKAGTAHVTLHGEFQWEGFPRHVQGAIVLVATDPVPEVAMTFTEGTQTPAPPPATPPAVPPDQPPPPPPPTNAPEAPPAPAAPAAPVGPGGPLNPPPTASSRPQGRAATPPRR